MHGSLPLTSPRITADDIPWILSLGYERYGPYDPGGVLLMLLQGLRSEATLMIRSEPKNAVLVANYVTPPWYPNRRECHVMFLVSKSGAHWQAMKLLRESVAWARLQGCARWRFHSETAHDVGALCRYVGAREDSPRYVVDL